MQDSVIETSSSSTLYFLRESDGTERLEVTVEFLTTGDVQSTIALQFLQF